MFLVKWQDLTEKVVYRKFTEIYEFHVSKDLVPAAILDMLHLVVSHRSFPVERLKTLCTRLEAH